MQLSLFHGFGYRYPDIVGSIVDLSPGWRRCVQSLQKKIQIKCGTTLFWGVLFFDDAILISLVIPLRKEEKRKRGKLENCGQTCGVLK